MNSIPSSPSGLLGSGMGHEPAEILPGAILGYPFNRGSFPARPVVSPRESLFALGIGVACIVGAKYVGAFKKVI